MGPHTQRGHASACPTPPGGTTGRLPRSSSAPPLTGARAPAIRAAARRAAARPRGERDRAAQPAERGGALMLVRRGAQVDLRRRGQPVRLEQIDEQAELDPVTGAERDTLEYGAARRVLTGKRLDEPGEQRPV